MLYLTNERAQMLDGYLRDAQSTAADIQQGTADPDSGALASAAPILDSLAKARAMLAAEMARGDKLTTVNQDTPGFGALRELVEWCGDALIADLRTRAEVTGSVLSRGKAQWIPISAAVFRLVWPDPLPAVPDGQVSVDIPPVVVSD